MVPDNAVELPKALHDPIARMAQVLAFDRLRKSTVTSRAAGRLGLQHGVKTVRVNKFNSNIHRFSRVVLPKRIPLHLRLSLRIGR